MLTDRLATLKKAESLARDGQIPEAIAEYLLLVEDQPGEWSAGNALGDLYLKSGQRDLAADVFVQMADSQRDQGFVPKAVALYKKALKARSADERALLGLADVAVAQEIFADARRYLEQVVTLREARGDASGAAACAERLAQVPTRRAPGARALKSTLPTVPPPARDAVPTDAPPEALALAPDVTGADGETADTLSLDRGGASDVQDATPSLPGSLVAPVSVDAAAPEAAPPGTGPHESAPERAVIMVESFSAGSFEPTSIDHEALTRSIEPVSSVGDEPPRAAATHLRDELDAAAHDADAVDLGALLDAPFTDAPAPEVVAAHDTPAPAKMATRPTPAAPPAPKAAVRVIPDDAPGAVAPKPPAPAAVKPAPMPAVKPAPPPLAAKSTPPLAKPAPVARAGATPVTPPTAAPGAFDPFATLAAPAPSGADEAGPPDGDAVMAELEAAAQVPALRFQASAQLGRLLVERGDLSGAAVWLERAAQEPAPVPEHGVSVVYDLAMVCERMGQVDRALALFAEIESESSAYRDVRARIARLSAGGGGPGA